MNKSAKVFLLFFLVVNILLGYYFLFTDSFISKEPPFHPFELNPNLTLQSLVAQGYSFDSAPCGQVQYTKQLADTIIQYEIQIDCRSKMNTLFEKILPDGFFLQTKTIIENDKDLSLEQAIADNKYYPWDINKIQNCNQKIYWSVYTVNLGSILNLTKVREFITSKGAKIIMETTDNLKGGVIMVYYPENRMFFNIRITFKQGKYWELTILRIIPDILIADHIQ